MAEREAITVRAELRAGRGKNDARRLRARGFVPLTVYGGGGEPVAAAAPLRELAAILRSEAGRNTVFTLDVEGVGASEVLFLDRQIDPVKGRLVHADLRRLVQGEEVEVTVRLELEGEPAGTKEEGGILEQLLREVEIRCRPNLIPDAIRADVSALRVHDVLHVSDLKVEEGVTILTDPDTVVAPEVIGKGKKEEEGEE